MRWACLFGRIHGDGYPAFFIEDTGIICVACDPFNYWAMGLEDFADIGAPQANPFGVSGAMPRLPLSAKNRHGVHGFSPLLDLAVP